MKGYNIMLFVSFPACDLTSIGRVFAGHKKVRKST